MMLSEAHFRDSSYFMERKKNTHRTDSKEEGERRGAAKHVL